MRDNPVFKASNQQKESIRKIKAELDAGRLSLQNIKLALEEGFSCYGSSCNNCEIRTIRESLKLSIACSDICGALVNILLTAQPCVKPAVVYSCKGCANYTASGCREHIDWYPEENDFCSRFKEIGGAD